MENKNKKLLTLLVIFFVLVISFFLYARLVATSGLFVKEYKITNEKILDDFHGFKIVHISDLHYGTSVGINEIEDIVNKINYISPDIVLFTGDLIDRTIDLSSNEKNTIISAFQKIEPNLGNYAITGKHDVENDNYYEILKKSNFTLLDDEIETIYKNNTTPILLTGLSSTNKSNDLESKMSATNEFLKEDENEYYHILMIHEPDLVNELDLNKFDLVLAGHSLNGQVRLPIIGPIILPEGAKTYFENKYIVNNTELYISSGVGTTRMQLRLFNRPSINFYRLTNK